MTGASLQVTVNAKILKSKTNKCSDLTNSIAELKM